MRLLAAAVLLAAACGPKSPSSTMRTGDEDTAAVALPDVPFEQLDHDQRAEFMKQKVVPVMQPLFQNHDPRHFAEFGCQTCHGAQANDGHFEMPNAELPKLNLDDLSKFEKADLAWMNQEIAPTMARILSQPLSSEDNPKGFGCLACHPVAGP